jgi:formylglycine-generating enzyme required for sulfatase activity
MILFEFMAAILALVFSGAAAIVFILSSGLLFSGKFIGNKYLVAMAGTLAVVSMSFFLWEQAGKPAGRALEAKDWLIALISNLRLNRIENTRATSPSADPPISPSRDSIRDCEDCPYLVRIPAGRYKIGSPRQERGHQASEEPQTDISIGKPFLIGRFKVTFAQWDACVDAGGCRHRPSDEDWGREDRPVLNVSWDDAQAYLSWLRTVTKKRYRLPSEAEWEYAARAGSEGAYSWGDNISPSLANYNNFLKKTVPAGMYTKNKFGLYQVHGNLGEWVEDCWHDSYAKIPRDGTPYRLGNCGVHSVRGGYWAFGPEMIRSASRAFGDHDARSKLFGFRVARDLNPE